MSPHIDHEHKDEERPPVFGTWRLFYTAVIAWLGLLIFIFYLFTRHFS